MRKGQPPGRFTASPAIDGSFTRGIHKDKDHEFYVRALTLTTHEIDIRIIAESVETEQERTTLEQINVDGLQGYLIGHPLARGADDRPGAGAVKDPAPAADRRGLPLA